MTVLFGTSKGRASHPMKEASFHLRNKPSWARKPTHSGQQTRYREHSCTRSSRNPQPLKRCRQTPLKAGACLFTRFTVGGIPRSLGPVSDKRLIKVLKPHPGNNPEERKPGNLPFYAFRQFVKSPEIVGYASVF